MYVISSRTWSNCLPDNLFSSLSLVLSISRVGLPSTPLLLVIINLSPIFPTLPDACKINEQIFISNDIQLFCCLLFYSRKHCTQIIHRRTVRICTAFIFYTKTIKQFSTNSFKYLSRAILLILICLQIQLLPTGFYSPKFYFRENPWSLKTVYSSWILNEQMFVSNTIQPLNTLISVCNTHFNQDLFSSAHILL